MLHSHFYLQISGNTINDTVISYQAAVEKCQAEGARLMPFRFMNMIWTFFSTRYQQMFQPNFLYYYSGSLVALGIKHGSLDGVSDPVFYYSDNQVVDDRIKTKIENELGAPLGPGTQCLGFYNKQFWPYDCAQEFNDGSDTSAALGYICEARHIKTKDSDIVCVFPFVYNNVTHDSCAFDINEDLESNGLPWCATDVHEDKTPKKTAFCQDERELIIEKDGSGNFCPLPFLFNGVWYDYCTRKDPTSETKFVDYFWCPDPSAVNDTNEYISGNSVGKCPDFLKPPENGCGENYTPINDKVCVRFSAYAETYQDAKAMCESEGSYLLQFLNEEIEEDVATAFTNVSLLPRYENVKQFWIGAEFKDNGWKWSDSLQRFNGNFILYKT